MYKMCCFGMVEKWSVEWCSFHPSI